NQPARAACAGRPGARGRAADGRGQDSTHPGDGSSLGSARITAPPVLQLRHLTKQFPGVLANDKVDFDLRRGEVHALLGENGAGKSTLMNIVYGLYHADEGEIRVKDEPVRIHPPKSAISRGVGMVHQHFMLIPVMTVAENIVLATEPRTGGVLLDYAAAEARVRDLSERFGLAV